MKINVWNTILQLSKERGVEPSVIIAAIEESLRVAASKFFTHGEAVQILFRPEKGELRPDEFIPVAEETGAIITAEEHQVAGEGRQARRSCRREHHSGHCRCPVRRHRPARSWTDRCRRANRNPPASPRPSSAPPPSTE